MRLLHFPCGWRSVPPEEEKLTPLAKAVPAVEEAAEWASPEKRRRRASRGAASSWRPALVKISEDSSNSVAALLTTAVKKGKAKAKAATTVVSRTSNDEYQHYGVVPTYAPTAFLF